MKNESATTTDAKPEPTWPFIFTLKKPREIVGQTVSFIELKEPSAEDGLEFGLLDGTIGAAGWVAMIVKLSEKPEAMIKRLPATEMMRFISELSDFLLTEAKSGPV